MGEPLAPPGREIRNQDLFAEVKLRLENKDPATGPAFTKMKRRYEPTEQIRMRKLVGDDRLGRQNQLAIDDLRDHVVGSIENVLVRRLPPFA